MDTTTADTPEIIAPHEVAAAVNATRGQLRDRNVSVTDPASLSRSIIEAIGQRITPDRIAQTIDKLLAAKRMTKFGPEDDPRAIEAGTKLYLAYMLGLPVQRIEQININATADPDAGLEDRIKASPALQAKLQSILDRAKSTDA